MSSYFLCTFFMFKLVCELNDRMAVMKKEHSSFCLMMVKLVMDLPAPIERPLRVDYNGKVEIVAACCCSFPYFKSFL